MIGSLCGMCERRDRCAAAGSWGRVLADDINTTQEIKED